MSSKKSIESIGHPLYKSVVSLPPGENIREWEKPIDLTTNFNLVNKPLPNTSIASSSDGQNKRIFGISLIKPTMILIQEIFSNYIYKNNEVFEVCEPAGRIKLIETVINNKKQHKPENYNFGNSKNKSNKSNKTSCRDGFGSQISFWIQSAKTDQIYKVKVFNGGKIQIPGVVDKNDITEVIEYLRLFLNDQLTKIQNFVPINPIAGNSMVDLGDARKCELYIPEDIFIDFFELKRCLKEVKAQQHLSMTNPPTNPLFEIVWPIFKIDGDPYQKKCYFNIFNPRHGVNKITMCRIEFNSIKKENNGMFYYSIILSGSSDERHINYIYRFLWEFISRYQNFIFYKKNTGFDNTDIATFNQIEALKQLCLEELKEVNHN